MFQVNFLSICEHGCVFKRLFYKKEAFCLFMTPKQMSFLIISNEDVLQNLGRVKVAPNKGLEQALIFTKYLNVQILLLTNPQKSTHSTHRCKINSNFLSLLRLLYSKFKSFQLLMNFILPVEEQVLHTSLCSKQLLHVQCLPPRKKYLAD